MVNFINNKIAYEHSDEVKRLIGKPPKAFILYGNTGIIIATLALITSTLFMKFPYVVNNPITFVAKSQNNVKGSSKKTKVFLAVTAQCDVRAGQQSVVTTRVKGEHTPADSSGRAQKNTVKTFIREDNVFEILFDPLIKKALN